jgi:hypothetical protein
MIDPLLTFAATNSNRCPPEDAPLTSSNVGTFAMGNESQAPRGPLGLIPSLRARIARYHEQATYFTRLAEASRKDPRSMEKLGA